MTRIILLSLFMSTYYVLAAQDFGGNIKTHQDPRIDSLVAKHIALNKIDPCIKGWRINIFFEAGNMSKKLAIEAKSRFVQNHADIPCYLVFQEPYYKIRIGDFRTKAEAMKVLKEISDEYPNAFVVEDHINFPQL